MTKKDGDKLRRMQEELSEMQDAYGNDSRTGAALSEVRYALTYALRGEVFEVRPTHPVTGKLLDRHGGDRRALGHQDALNGVRPAYPNDRNYMMGYSAGQR